MTAAHRSSFMARLARPSPDRDGTQQATEVREIILGMHIVALAWIYVVGMASIAEALSPQGTVLGAVITFVFWGVLPLGVVLYLIGTPARKKARRRREAAEAEAAAREGVEGAAADVAEAPPPVTALHGTVPDAPAPPRRLR